MKKKIASGSVFRRTYRDAKGKMVRAHLWTLKYYANGNPRQEPSGTDNYDDAVAMLRKRMAELSMISEHTEHPQRVRMSQLLDLLIEDYKFQRHKSLYDTVQRVNANLRPFFGSMKANAVGTVVLKRFIQRRQQQEKSAATINVC